MKIIFVATGAKGKNVVFVSDTLQSYSLGEAVRLTKEGEFGNVYVVNGRGGEYLRTSRSAPKKEQLEQLAVSSRQLFTFAQDTRYAVSTPAIARYLQLYQYTIEKGGGPLIAIDGRAKITKEAAKMKLQPHRKVIFDAAEKFNIDPYLLGAIIIDEIARFGPWESITDPLAGYFVGVNTSAGIAQVKTDTARGLIQEGYYNPNPNDPKLSPDKIKKTFRMDLYEYTKQPKHSIFFAAARMRALIDEWKKFVDLETMPEIVATLYHLPYKKPHGAPEANARGLQITEEFYQLAKEWLK